jgi:ribulose-phosphate 3-epimerase
MNIIPTIFVKRGTSIIERFGKVVPIAKRIQIDIMDGVFVKSKSIVIEDIPDLLGYKKEFEAHLMTKNPENYIVKLKEKGFRRVIYHYESVASELDVKYVAAVIRRNKMIPVLAINPETHVDVCFSLLKTIGHFLLMGVHPGEEKQTFIPGILDKVKELRHKSKSCIIQVDGGVTPTIAKKLAKVGCSFVNSGSYISDAKNPAKAIQKLQEAFT